jgi:vancomycin resistance protein YoaR
MVKKKKILIFGEVLILLAAFFELFFLKKIYPRTFVAGINLGGKTQGEAVKLLSEKANFPEKITLQAETQNFDLPLEKIGFSWDPAKTVDTAYNYHRTGNVFIDSQRQILSLFKKTNLALSVSFDEEKLGKNLAVVETTLAIDPVYPELKIKLGKVWVEKGKVGTRVDLKLLRVKIGHALATLSNQPVEIPIMQIDPSLTDAEAEAYRFRGENLFNKNLSLKYDLYNNYLSGQTLIKFLEAKGEYQNQEVSALVQKTVSELNSEPQDSAFIFEAGKVQEFTPAKDGVTVKEDLLKNMILGNLRTLETTEEKSIILEIPVTLTPPKIQTGDVNNLGIRELLGRGVSYFRGSIPGRIHNISIASSRFKGVLVKPGEVFSFNKTLGDVSKETGYQEAYIIKEGRTILGDGGGVCQVSTTLFRAILNSGLPVIERRAHSYRVSYYEQSSQVGLDATVYDPTADLKFKNDTPAHLLIQPTFNPKNSQLIFEVYGTNDGRIAKISKSTIADLVAPPEDLYQDDPTLPAGTLKQIDWKAWGAKVTFTYTVTRNSETLYKKTFTSNYQPWQAIYLRGIGPIQ